MSVSIEVGMATEIASENWWQAFYDETPFELFLERSDSDAMQVTVEFLFEKLGLAANALVFDQCCGKGSVSIPLAERGVSVIGVDLCGKYIESAQKSANEKGLKCRFEKADAFLFKTEAQCDAAVNWWTSFGYSEDDERNKEMLRRVFQSLKPGGKFALDYPNIARVLKKGSGSEVRRYAEEGGEVMIVRETTLNLVRGLRQQLWTFIMPDGSTLVHDTLIKMYLPVTIVEMLEDVGFDAIEVFGSVFGDALTESSERSIFVSRRPQ